MRILSLNIGGPQSMTRNGKTVTTSMNRTPVAEPTQLEFLGFAGDKAANGKVHGGPDKAVCCYPAEHYPYFREKLAASLEIPAFGENLTTEGLFESEVCIGDVFQIGQATVQISQPRQPCGTLAMRNGNPELPKWVNEKLYTGFYFRVLKPGIVRVHDAVKLIERPNAGATVETLSIAMLNKQTPRGQVEQWVALPELSQSWRETFTQRLG